MPDRLILHIGMHKTGTTALQSALAGYDDGDTRMARLRHANHSIQMLTCFAANPARYHVWVRQGLLPEKVLAIRAAMLRELADELALPRRQLIISGEEMSLMHKASVHHMADTLAPLCREVAVLAWLRPAVSYIGSALQQMIRAGQSSLTLPRPSYRARFAMFANRYGRDAMTYRPYVSGGPSTLAEFCMLAGIAPQSVTDRTENVALAPDALRLIWLLNRDGPPTSGSPLLLTARSATIRHLAQRFDGRFDLPADMAAGGIDRADIAWAEAETGLTLSQGLTDADPDRAPGLLRDWLSTVTGPMLATLDHDLDRLGIRLTGAPSASARVIALFNHYVTAAKAEAEAKEAVATIFRAGNRAGHRASLPAQGAALRH